MGAVFKELGEILSLLIGLVITLMLIGLFGLTITKVQESFLIPAVRIIKKLFNRR